SRPRSLPSRPGGGEPPSPACRRRPASPPSPGSAAPPSTSPSPCARSRRSGPSFQPIGRHGAGSSRIPSRMGVGPRAPLPLVHHEGHAERDRVLHHLPDDRRRRPDLVLVGLEEELVVQLEDESRAVPLLREKRVD